VASTSHLNGDVKDPKDKGSKVRNLRQLKKAIVSLEILDPSRIETEKALVIVQVGGWEVSSQPQPTAKRSLEKRTHAGRVIGTA